MALPVVNKVPEAWPACQVLVVGAGPTGLVLAYCLARMGVAVRIIDRNDGPGRTSRAIVLHARNLEFYRQLGIAEKAVQQGVKFEAANLWTQGRKVARAPFGDIGEQLSRFPYMLIFTQDQHEALLLAELEKLGVSVERKTELVQLQVVQGFAEATLRGSDQREEKVRASYLAGCDGAHSTVRDLLGIGFAGGTYSETFYVADVIGNGSLIDGEMHAALDDADFLATFPLKGAGRARLVGEMKRSTGEGGPRWEDVSKKVIERLGIDIETVHWFSTYRVHHRVAESFRKGPIFLLGDAAHVHSPVGGQGMNTGIGDAFNLAWKLVGVIQGRLKLGGLDSYEPERIAFAKKLVETTDLAFQFITARNRFADWIRVVLVPVVAPRLLRLRAMRRFMFRTLSQISICYRACPLSIGSAGRVSAGDRLPWIQLDGVAAEDNYDSLRTLDWQVHCYGDRATTDLRHLCSAEKMPLEIFPWQDSMRRAGLAEGSFYLVRPDGYVGCAGSRRELSRLIDYLDRHGIRARQVGHSPRS